MPANRMHALYNSKTRWPMADVRHITQVSQPNTYVRLGRHKYMERSPSLPTLTAVTPGYQGGRPSTRRCQLDTCSCTIIASVRALFVPIVVLTQLTSTNCFTHYCIQITKAPSPSLIRIYRACNHRQAQLYLSPASLTQFRCYVLMG